MPQKFKKEVHVEVRGTREAPKLRDQGQQAEITLRNPRAIRRSEHPPEIIPPGKALPRKNRRHVRNAGKRKKKKSISVEVPKRDRLPWRRAEGVGGEA
jgi:hypothetical protein